MYLENKNKNALGTITKGQDKSSKLISYIIKKTQKIWGTIWPQQY